MQHTDPDKKVNAIPIVIGPANAEAVTGFPWRWCRDFAAAHGVPLVGTKKKQGIIAARFLAALESNPPSDETTEPTASVVVDPAEHVRALLGKTRRSA